MRDSELLLRRARRPLVIGMGGGGDVVGALATAELIRIYDGGDPVLGGLTWERRPFDPVPGPRAVAEITDAEELAPGILLAGPDTRLRDRDVFFAESRMAEFLGQRTLLIDINDGPGPVAEGLAQAIAALKCDLLVLVDVGGDVVARGDEPGLRSPLCDAVMLAAGGRLSRRGQPVLLGIFGIGCDAELTPAEVLARVSEVAAAGGLCGARGLTGPVAERMEAAIELVSTEASAQAVRAFRGASGRVAIRGGTRTLELTPAAALTFYLDVDITIKVAGRLARAVADAGSLEQANDSLGALGIATELDYEREAAGVETARSTGRPLERRRVIDALDLDRDVHRPAARALDAKLAVHVLGWHRGREHIAALDAHVVVGAVAVEDRPVGALLDGRPAVARDLALADMPHRDRRHLRSPTAPPASR